MEKQPIFKIVKWGRGDRATKIQQKTSESVIWSFAYSAEEFEEKIKNYTTSKMYNEERHREILRDYVRYLNMKIHPNYFNPWSYKAQYATIPLEQYYNAIKKLKIILKEKDDNNE